MAAKQACYARQVPTTINVKREAAVVIAACLAVACRAETRAAICFCGLPAWPLPRAGRKVILLDLRYLMSQLAMNTPTAMALVPQSHVHNA